MIEIIVASTVFAGVMVAAMSVTLNTTRSISDGTGYIKSEIAAAKVLDRLAEDLASAQFSSVTISNSPYTGAQVNFRKITGYDYANSAQILYPNVIVWRWIPNEGASGGLGTNGVDDDDNGVIDDGRLIREEYSSYPNVLVSTENIVDAVEWQGLVFDKLDSAIGPYMLGGRVRVFFKNYYYALDNASGANTNTDRINARTKKRAITQNYETVVSLRN
jgi:hypothetical protein